MIGKITKGSGFKGCVSYVLGKDRAELLDCSGVLSDSPQAVIKSFCTQSLLNPDIKKPVGHISLSYSLQDAPKLTNEKMVELAREYMREMKITDTQYMIVRHHDREHPHVHIVFNRIDNNGKTISDKNDRYRNEQVCKQLKTKYSLYFAKGKENVKQERLREPDRMKYEIYNAIKNGLKTAQNWQQLKDYLSDRDIRMQLKYKGQSGMVQGVSFAKGDYSFKGSEIDRGFSYSKLDALLCGNGQINKQEDLHIQPQDPKPKVSDFISGSGGLFNFSQSVPTPDNNEDLQLQQLKKKKKRKRLKL